MAKKKSQPFYHRNVSPFVWIPIIIIAVVGIFIAQKYQDTSLDNRSRAAAPVKSYMPYVIQDKWVGAEWFGRWRGTEEFAQTFTPAANKKLRKVTVGLLNTFNGSGPEPAVSLEIWSDGGGAPGQMLGKSINEIKAFDTNSYIQDYDFNFDGPRLMKGNIYWLVARVSMDYIDMPFGFGYWHDTVDVYPEGKLYLHTNGAWVEHHKYSGDYSDAYFKLYY